MKHPPVGLVVLIVAIWSLAHAQESRPFLSHLNATKDSPIFTTYAAAMERSEFMLDKGYHLVYYDSARGADFTNETAGNMCLAFKSRGKYVYAVQDMFHPPVITTSYSDMVIYTFYPFEDIKVTVTFLAYSSRYALQTIDIANTGKKTTRVEVLPFLLTHARPYEGIEFRKEPQAITFRHEEFPDDWVLDHKIPYVNEVRDVYALSDPPDRMISYRSYRGGDVEIPQVYDLKKQPVYLIWGKLGLPGGGRCHGESGASRLMAVLNNDRTKILTESAPRWGNAESNITGYGSYGLEFGNFGPIRQGDRFTIYGMCGDEYPGGMIEGIARNRYDGDSSRYDIIAGTTMGPKSPGGLRMDSVRGRADVRLSWENCAGAVSYNVYRRDYRAGGVYNLIGGNVRQTAFTDKAISPDKVYGYVVTALDGAGAMSMHSAEVNTIAGSDFLTGIRWPGKEVSAVKDLARVIGFSRSYDLRAGSMHRLIAVRGVGRMSDNLNQMIDSAHGFASLDLHHHLEADEKLYSGIPPLTGVDPNEELLYWSAFSLMRQVMLPAEGKCRENYYVFSREPQWGWGHGGQVFHESLTMLSYAMMDGMSAMNSQRVYRDRQRPDGYINYRTGPYLDEEISYNGQVTTSAPWYAWENWEVYRVTHDRKFLEESYESSANFYRFFVKNRDADGDGLCEWGAHAVLESVRDGQVAVWDEVGWPSNFESVDVNSMLVSEAKALGLMAAELGRTAAAAEWRKDAETRSEKINAQMWDEKTGFYYNIGKDSHTFTYQKAGDLKREEIIGFLPLWAGIASKSQAARLVEKLKDQGKFWRAYGVPSLAADDSYYNAKGYWNGPVWVQWDYLIERGLLQYGYVQEARELVGKVVRAMVAQLKKDHNFWEFYSPDEEWAGYHKTYIWAGIVNRMILDLNQTGRKP